MKCLVVLALLVAYVSGDCGVLERLKVKQQWVQAFGQGTDREEFGLRLFALIFQAAPDTRALFERVNGNNEFSNAFIAHTQRVLGGLDMSIALLDDQETLDAELSHLKSQHDERGIPASAFGVFKSALGKALAKELGRTFDKESWGDCFDVISSGITG